MRPEPALTRGPAPIPRVLALTVPALPLQRLLRLRLRESGGPVAILHEGRVVHCDAGAWAAGVRPGQTAAEALAACGRLEGVPLDEASDRAALRALAEAVLLLAPAVEVVAPDTLLLDASAARLLLQARDERSQACALEEGERVLAERAIAAAREMGYEARAAVASGRAPAAALARSFDKLRMSGSFDRLRMSGGGELRWLRVPPEETARALAGLPLESLGLGPAITGRLRALGIADAGALARLPAGSLAHRFGPDGVRAARLARGEDGGPLAPYAPATLPEEALDLEGPAESAEPLLFALKRLADRVAARLAGRGLGATRLRVTLKLDPRGEERLLVPLARPTAEAARWLVPVKELIFALRLPGAVVGLRLAALEVGTLPAEQLAFGDRPEALAALESVLARLSSRLGDGALFAAEPVERYRPEGAYRTVPFKTNTRRTSTARPSTTPAHAERASTTARGAEHRGAYAQHERPIEEPLDPARRPTRLLATPQLVVAEGEGGRLTALRVEGRDRAVLDLTGPERLAGEWFLRASTPGSPREPYAQQAQDERGPSLDYGPRRGPTLGMNGHPVPAAGFDRDYFRIRLEGLGDCWVYRDGADGRLWLHGFFD